MYRYLVLFGSGSALYIQKQLLSMISADFCDETYLLNVAETREVCSNLMTNRLYTLPVSYCRQRIISMLRSKCHQCH